MNETGTYLMQGRERAGMTLADLSGVTRIQEPVLRALEQGQWDRIGSPSQVRGFLISYCRAVGLDPEPALAALADHRRRLRDLRADAEPAQDPSFALVGDIVVNRAREPVLNWTYVAIVIVFMVGILVAILTVGTGPGLEDVSRLMDTPKVQTMDPVPHG